MILTWSITPKPITRGSAGSHAAVLISQKRRADTQIGHISPPTVLFWIKFAYALETASRPR